MANDLKLDKLDKLDQISRQQLVSRELPQENPANHSAVAPAAPESVLITSNLGNFVKSMLADNNDTSDNQHRIVELKRQIENNQYTVDVDTLASKLAHTLMPSK